MCNFRNTLHCSLAFKPHSSLLEVFPVSPYLFLLLFLITKKFRLCWNCLCLRSPDFNLISWSSECHFEDTSVLLQSMNCCNYCSLFERAHETSLHLRGKRRAQNNFGANFYFIPFPPQNGMISAPASRWELWITSFFEINKKNNIKNFDLLLLIWASLTVNSMSYIKKKNNKK